MNQNVKIAIAAAALLVGVGLLGWFLMSGGPDGGPTGKQAFVNVTTGEIVYLSQRNGDFKTIPAKDKRGKLTLFPVHQEEGGAWILEERYRGGVETGLQAGWFTQAELKVDPETFRIIGG